MALRGIDDEQFAGRPDDFFGEKMRLVDRQDAVHLAEEVLAHAAMVAGDAGNGGFDRGIFLPGAL
jgi:hypothetical protein